MLQRMTLFDWIVTAVAVFGILVALYHLANDAALAGALVIAGVLLGGVVRYSTSDDVIPQLGMQSNDEAGETRALDGTGRWNDQPDDEKSIIWLRSSIIAGFTATIIMSIAMIFGYLLVSALADQDANQISQWFYGLTHNSLTDDTFEIPVGAYSINLLAGVIWALIYAAFFERRLRGSGWMRGATFSLLPWLLSLIVFFPVVGAGFFGADLDAGPLPVIGNLILHVIFGATLGGVYAALASAEVDLSDERLLQAGWIDEGIAVGLTGGLMVGLILGAFVGVLFDSGSVTVTEMTLAGGAAGILGGLLVGPLIGLETGSSQSAPRAT